MRVRRAALFVPVGAAAQEWQRYSVPSPARATPAKIDAIRYKRESKGELGAPSTRLVRLDLEQARDLSYKGKAAVEAPDFTRKQKGKGKRWLQ